jgi:hypothetical protein
MPVDYDTKNEDPSWHCLVICCQVEISGLTYDTRPCMRPANSSDIITVMHSEFQLLSFLMLVPK